MNNLVLTNEELTVVLSALQYAIDNGYYDDDIDAESLESALEKIIPAINEVVKCNS